MDLATLHCTSYSMYVSKLRCIIEIKLQCNLVQSCTFRLAVQICRMGSDSELEIYLMDANWPYLIIITYLNINLRALIHSHGLRSIAA